MKTLKQLEPVSAKRRARLEAGGAIIDADGYVITYNFKKAGWRNHNNYNSNPVREKHSPKMISGHKIKYHKYA
jgi:hypothetical protein